MLLFPRKDKPELPDWWLNYQNMNRIPIRPGIPLESLTFSVIDLETTGLDPRNDRMIAFAGVRIQDLKIHVKDTLEFIINPQDVGADEAVHIHELTLKEKQKGLPVSEAVPIMLQFIGNSILVGFHIQFDCNFINQALKKLTGKKLLNPILDIDLLVRRIEEPVHQVHPRLQRNLLQLCGDYGISVTDPHTAAGDAFASAELLLKILQRLKKRGISNLQGLKKR
jgi:DNA polymerase III subunit epsilon